MTVPSGLGERLGQAIEQCLGRAARDAPRKIAVALSGGGDSLALLLAAHDCSQTTQDTLMALTVDHGLRAESAAEAQFCSEICHSLGIKHETVKLGGLDPTRNVMSEARTARYAALTKAAKDHGLHAILVGHTQDDVAETFLMRLARGAGVDGLAMMKDAFPEANGPFFRPFLGITREHLRQYLTDAGVDWIDDPTNVDEKHLRTRTRQALDVLADLGITRHQISQSASALRGASDVLLEHSASLLDQIFTVEPGGFLTLNHPALARHEGEVAHRLLKMALGWFGGSVWGLRRAEFENFQSAAMARSSVTLGGVWMTPGFDADLRLFREPAATMGRVPVGTLWDHRWRMIGPSREGLTIGAVGEHGLALCPDWRETHIDRRALLTTPGVWDGETLIAAPLAGLNDEWIAQIVTSFSIVGL